MPQRLPTSSLLDTLLPWVPKSYQMFLLRLTAHLFHFTLGPYELSAGLGTIVHDFSNIVDSWSILTATTIKLSLPRRTEDNVPPLEAYQPVYGCKGANA